MLYHWGADCRDSLEGGCSVGKFMLSSFFIIELIKDGRSFCQGLEGGGHLVGYRCSKRQKLLVKIIGSVNRLSE